MLCDLCKKNEATVHSISLGNGELRELHVCYNCACKNGNASIFNISDYIAGFFAREKADSAQKACPVCNMTLKEFETKGRLGCGECYATFASELVPVIKSVQSSLQHTGKTPANRRDAELERDIARMKKELEKAVSEENYELAAELRDRIKQATNALRWE